MLVAGKLAWVPHVKLLVKCLWYSGKFTCARRQFAYVLREVLAALKQVNLPVFTGKLHVTQVNCARHLFTCQLQVKLPEFPGNFARASFTVFVIQDIINLQNRQTQVEISAEIFRRSRWISGKNAETLALCWKITAVTGVLEKFVTLTGVQGNGDC